MKRKSNERYSVKSKRLECPYCGEYYHARGLTTHTLRCRTLTVSEASNPHGERASHAMSDTAAISQGEEMYNLQSGEAPIDQENTISGKYTTDDYNYLTMQICPLCGNECALEEPAAIHFNGKVTQCPSCHSQDCHRRHLRSEAYKEKQRAMPTRYEKIWTMREDAIRRFGGW